MKITVPQMTDCVDSSYVVDMPFQDAIQAGIDALRAVKIGKHYVYWADEVGYPYRITATELAEYGAGQIDDRGADYSLWCSWSGERIKRPRKSTLIALGRIVA